MSAKRPAAPLDQAAVKRSRVQEDAVAHEASRHAVAGQLSRTAHSSRPAPPSSNSAAQVGASRGVAARDQSAHSHVSSHGASQTAGALNMSAAQRAPRAAHSGSPAAAPPRSGYANVVGASAKTSPSSGGLSFGALKQSVGASSGQSQSQQSSTAALASLLPLLYGAGSGERNLEVAAAQLASGALKQTASGQSQSLLSSLTAPLGNINIASLGTLLNYQMAAAIQKLGVPAAAKKESPAGNSHSHAHASSASSRPASSKTNAPSSTPPANSQKQALTSGALNVPLNLTGTNTGATLHHHASQQSHFAAYGTSDAPIDLSKKTSGAAPPKVRSSTALPPPAPKARLPEPTRADSAVPANDARLERERERDHHGRTDVTRSSENAPVTRERDRTPLGAEKLANGEAERQIPVITLSDDEAESEDDESAALFDGEFAEVERLSAPLTDDPESPIDRAALVAARKRLVRELRRSLVDEEARMELLRRWNSHNAVNAREQPKSGATLNGKMAPPHAATPTGQVRASKGATPQTPAGNKRELSATRTTPQPAHAHGAATVLNGGPPNVTINQQPAHGGQPNTPAGSVPLKVPRVSSSSELSKSTTTPRGPQSGLQNATPASSGKPQSGATGSTQKGTPQLSSAQLQAQLAASKLALRKQVEKTLGQLAPPKAVVGADIQFVPSVNYTDLLCLVGLDETVNALQRFEAKNVPTANGPAVPNGVPPNPAAATSDPANANGVPNGVPQPAVEGKRSSPASELQVRTCIQCETDFTPTWRVADRTLLNATAQKRLAAMRDTAPRSTFHVCERCAVHNQKKTIRSDYLAKLKQTFTQLARDERELEERYTSLIAQAPQSVPNSNASLGGSSHNSSHTLHATPTGSNRSVNAVQSALKEAQQLLSASGSASNSSRGTASPTPASASSLANSLSLGAGSQSFNSATAINAFTAFTAAMNAAANAMKTSSSSTALNLNAASLGNALNATGINASALTSGLNASALGVGGALNPASISAALQAFLSLQNPSFSAAASRAASSSTHSTAASNSASGSSSSAFPSQFSDAARSTAAAFGVNSQPNASSGASPVKTAADLHRQYYLEMVTRPPVLPSWKK